MLAGCHTLVIIHPYNGLPLVIVTTVNKNMNRPKARILTSFCEISKLEIVDLLIKGEKNVTEVQTHFGFSQAKTSRHLNHLKYVGILDSRRENSSMIYFVDKSNYNFVKNIVDLLN